MSRAIGAQSVPDRRPALLFGGAVLAGALVAVAAGVYGSTHDPASETTVRWFFSGTLHFKAWFTTVVLVLAIIQLILGMWMYGRLPGSPNAPAWVGPVHRICGSLALLVSLPVAYHCLWSLGFNPDPGGGRRLWHSLFGCAFYGAFATKLIVVRSPRMPAWAVPVVGGVLFVVLVVVWLTSSLWFFGEFGVEV